MKTAPFKKFAALTTVLLMLCCLGCNGNITDPHPSPTPEPSPTASLPSSTPYRNDGGYRVDELDGIPGPNDVVPMHDYAQYEQIKAKNPDVIGWINIPDTAIDYPVVRCADNDYYLTHDIDHNDSKFGAIFMDYRNADSAQQKHIIIYGHNMKNGTMFRDLMNYKIKDFFDQNKIIRFLWDGTETQWQVFLAYIVYPSIVYHIHTWFSTDQNFADVINETIEYAKTVTPSNIDKSVKIQPGDQVLTLSTCTYERDGSFFAIMARRIK